MIVKYNMLGNITSEQFKSDIVGLIRGTISNVGGLSAGCDSARTTFTGTYPAAKYTLVGAETNTFSKVHSVDSGTTHYFRLNFGTFFLVISLHIAYQKPLGVFLLLVKSIAIVFLL